MTRCRIVLVLFVTFVVLALHPPISAAPQSIHLLALRVEFPFEDPDDFTTGGRGVFDLRTPAEALAAADTNENVFRYPYDLPPHDANFLSNHLHALANYLHVASRGQVNLTWEMFPPTGAAYTAPRELAWYGSASNDADQLDRWVTFLNDALGVSAADIGALNRFDSFLVFNASVSRQEILSTELPALALTPVELARSTVTVPSGVQSAWFIPQQIQEPGGVIGLNGTFVSTFFATQNVPVLLNTATGGSSLGGWTVMDIGSDNLIRRLKPNGDTTAVLGFIPALPMAWEQTRLGWLDPVEVRRDTTMQLAYLGISNTDLSHAIRVPITQDEYYLLELRKSIKDTGDFRTWDHPEIDYSRDDTSGVWLRPKNDFYDAYTPGSGVIVYHVDEARIRQWEPTNEVNNHRERPGIYIVEADGYRDIGIVNLLGHPRSSQGIGNPQDPFKVTGDTLHATGEWGPGRPVSIANDGSHTGIRIVTSPYGVTGDSVTVSVQWINESNESARRTRYVGGSVVEGVTAGPLFEAWTSLTTDTVIVFATNDQNVWVLDTDLEPVQSDTGVIGRTNFPILHKPAITGNGEITVYGANQTARFVHSATGWRRYESATDPWIAPTLVADLDRDGFPYTIRWDSVGVIAAAKSSAETWTFSVGDSLVAQPTIGTWQDDGFGYLYAATPRRVVVISRKGLEVDRFNIGSADSTWRFSHPALTRETGYVASGESFVLVRDRDRSATLFDDGRIHLAGRMAATPAIVSRDNALRIYSATDDGWLTRIDVTSTGGQPVWSQLYGDAKNSNTPRVISSTGPTPSSELMPRDQAFCWPSPVGNTEAHIRFYLTSRADIEARVYTSLGELVWRGTLDAGASSPNAHHEMTWPGGVKFASGLYLIRLEAKGVNGSRSGITIPVGIAK